MPKTRTHLSRPRKKKFQGNQFTAEAEADYVSSSAKKLKNADYDDVPVDRNSHYVICNFYLIFNALSEFLVCKSCHGAVKFGEVAGPGVGFKLTVDCSCERRQLVSSPMSHNVYEINRRLMFAFRVLGCGLESLRIFCSLLDIRHSFSHKIYYNFLDKLLVASKTVFEMVQRKAVREEIEANSAAGNEPTHLTVSGDGSWKKRGFSSQFGLVSLIGKHTVKILDVIVKSSYCQACRNWASKQGTPEFEEWSENHVDDCTANHTGSAGKMEMDGVQEMFLRSENLLGVKYQNYIGDGDTKTFKSILDLNPYADCPVSKKECVGHVQKRMGSRLRKLKKDTKGLGGKGSGKLTNKVIADLTLYYGMAIRSNPKSSEDMHNAIWATYFHKCSTSENPQHHFCPDKSDTWCKWQVAKREGTLATFKHPTPLADNVAEAIKPIYEALSTTELLKRCLGANTQNSNESFNATVWRLAPKHLHCGTQVVEISALIAACLFNEGRGALLRIMDAMEMSVGTEACRYSAAADAERITSAERNISLKARNARLEHRLQEKVNQQNFEIEEGVLYGPGISD